MPLPRPVFPDTTNLVTRRCTQRQFLLRPDPETNNAVIYCLAVAAQRCQVDVLNFVQMSNHLHQVIYDRHGNGPEFYQHFHKLLAKCMNVLRCRWENFFDSKQVGVVRLETRAALIKELVYVATNPVKDCLVEHVDDWPGASGYRALLSGEPLVATRPTFFFDPDGDMPEHVTLQLTIPPELGDRDEILAAVKSGVEETERQEAALRKRLGRRVLGSYAVRRQSWRESPTSREPRRQLSPRVAAVNKWALIEGLQRDRDFINAHRRARAAWLAKTPIPFPAGTYWLRKFLGAVTQTPAKNS